ncbi:MAG: hypothetical protein EB078_01595, partial [Proteobacteria bacterium]|nr:hypothetical protein [Pseudomonadota bacterium]
SPSGVLGFEELDETSRNQLFFEIEALKNQFHLILFDHSSGVHSGVTPFAAAAHQQIVVTTSEPTSYTDAYAIMKILSQKYSIREFWLMVTMSHSHNESDRIIDRFMDVVRSQLEVKIRLLDIFPWEPRLGEALRRQKPFVEIYPSDQFTQKLSEVCRRLEQSPLTQNHGLRFFYGAESEPRA